MRHRRLLYTTVLVSILLDKQISYLRAVLLRVSLHNMPIKTVANRNMFSDDMGTHMAVSIRWHHNGLDSVSNHQPHHCLLNRLFRRRRKHQSSASLAFVWGIHRGPAQMASNAENVSIMSFHVISHKMSFYNSCSTPGYCILIYLSRHWMVVTRQSMTRSSNGNIFRFTGPLCLEFTGLRWIPRTKASDAELWCL